MNFPFSSVKTVCAVPANEMVAKGIGRLSTESVTVPLTTVVWPYKHREHKMNKKNSTGLPKYLRFMNFAMSRCKRLLLLAGGKLIMCY